MKTGTCKNCIYAVRPIGREKPDLLCSNKTGLAGRFTYICENDRCRNFKPDRNNPWPLQPDSDIRYIPLTQGKFAIVDADDYPQLSKHKWYVLQSKNNWYACRVQNRKKLFMHRVIMNAPDDMLVDHKNNNSLNNRKSNLRLCNYEQNARNSRPTAKTSKYKGVSMRKDRKKWEAAIHIGKKHFHLGHFTDEIEAAKAYDKKAAELYGDFAYLNFPKPK